MLNALLIMAGLALLVSIAVYLTFKSSRKNDPLAVRIDAILPQTQCGQCNFPGCKPYATAIANGKADINQCPPGGEAGIRALAKLLDREYKPLNTEHGVHKPKALAIIDEDICIGCTLCLQACPVDAILGAARQMHTVIASECTGCELCLAPCPVDCIRMEPINGTPENLTSGHPRLRLSPVTLMQFYRHAKDRAIAKGKARHAANLARARYEFRLLRIDREKQQRMLKNAQRAADAKIATGNNGAAETAKKAAIAAAVERARILKAKAQPLNTDDMSLALQREIARIDARRNQVASRISQAQPELKSQRSEKVEAEGERK